MRILLVLLTLALVACPPPQYHYRYQHVVSHAGYLYVVGLTVETGAYWVLRCADVGGVMRCSEVELAGGYPPSQAPPPRPSPLRQDPASPPGL